MEDVADRADALGDGRHDSIEQVIQDGIEKACKPAEQIVDLCGGEAWQRADALTGENLVERQTAVDDWRLHKGDRREGRRLPER